MAEFNFFTSEELEELVLNGRVTKNVTMAGGLLELSLEFPTEKERSEINNKNLQEIKNRKPEEKKKITDIDAELTRMFDDEVITIKNTKTNNYIKFSDMNAAMADAIISKRSQLSSSIWSFMMEEKATEEEKK